MSQIKTVLCPIDFSDVSQQELRLAIDVCQAFSARLVLHHNLSTVSPGLTRAWEWNELHHADQVSSVQSEERMRRILADVPKTVTAQAMVSSGPLGTILIELAQQLPADLLVLGGHGWSTPDHASVSERVINQSPCAVLTIREGAEAATNFRLHSADADHPVRVVVPTDFSAGAQCAVDYAFALARRVPLHLHLMHVLPARSSETRSQVTACTLDDLVPADLVGNVFCHAEPGDPIELILNLARQIDAGCIVMGEHARDFIRHFFTRDTSREMLHRANCPVWFVPPPP